MPSTIPASWRLSAGNISAGGRARRAATAIGRRPCIGGIAPSSDRPPTTVIGRLWRLGNTPDAARMPSAIGRSNAAPTLRTSEGARLTVTRVVGNGKPELRIAVRTRSRLSRTVVSGSPTIVSPGKPDDTSTSTDTGIASTPKTAAADRRASTDYDRSNLPASGHRSDTRVTVAVFSTVEVQRSCRNCKGSASDRQLVANDDHVARELIDALQVIDADRKLTRDS